MDARRRICPRTSTALSSGSQTSLLGTCGNEKTAAAGRGGLSGIYREEANVLGRPGSDLLFQVLRLSTIGAGKFNGRVRDGIGFGLPANTTRPAKDVAGIRDQYQSSDSSQAGRANPNGIVRHLITDL